MKIISYKDLKKTDLTIKYNKLYYIINLKSYI